MAKRLVSVALETDENMALPEGATIVGFGQVVGQYPFLIYEHTQADVQVAVERRFVVVPFPEPGVKTYTPEGTLVGKYNTPRGEIWLVYEIAPD